MSVVSRKELVRAGHFGSREGILGRDRASWLYVATWFSLCRDIVSIFSLRKKMSRHGFFLLRQVLSRVGESMSR